MTNRKLVSVPLGLAILLGTGGAAFGQVVIGPTTQGSTNSSANSQGNLQTLSAGPTGTVVGSPNESNVQATTTPQATNQAGASGTVVGGQTQTAANTNTNSQGSVETLTPGPSNVVVGNPSAANTQTTNTPQVINQTGAAGVAVGATTQAQTNANANVTASVIII